MKKHMLLVAVLALSASHVLPMENGVSEQQKREDARLLAQLAISFASVWTAPNTPESRARQRAALEAIQTRLHGGAAPAAMAAQERDMLERLEALQREKEALIRAKKRELASASAEIDRLKKENLTMDTYHRERVPIIQREARAEVHQVKAREIAALKADYQAQLARETEEHRREIETMSDRIAELEAALDAGRSVELKV